MALPDLNKLIDDKVVALDAAKRAAHEPSGKLSAGMLAWPIQWSVLKLLGVEDTPPDTYALRKFARGNQVEDWFIDLVAEEGCVTQKEVDYRGCIGFVDLVTDDGFPHEVKSVTNLKWKRIVQGYKSKNVPPAGPQYSHALQAGFYALALGKPEAYIHYIASDDLRLASFAIPVEDVQGDINTTISSVHRALEEGYIPVFEQREDWNNMPDYAKYWDWMQLTREQLEHKLKTEYPESYNKLKQGAKHGKQVSQS